MKGLSLFLLLEHLYFCCFVHHSAPGWVLRREKPPMFYSPRRKSHSEEKQDTYNYTRLMTFNTLGLKTWCHWVLMFLSWIAPLPAKAPGGVSALAANWEAEWEPCDTGRCWGSRRSYGLRERDGAGKQQELLLLLHVDRKHWSFCF